jgi:hypothetical protein
MIILYFANKGYFPRVEPSYIWYMAGAEILIEVSMLWVLTVLAIKHG